MYYHCLQLCGEWHAIYCRITRDGGEHFALPYDSDQARARTARFLTLHAARYLNTDDICGEFLFIRIFMHVSDRCI